jgi:hypothetical protein
LVPLERTIRRNETIIEIPEKERPLIDDWSVLRLSIIISCIVLPSLVLFGSVNSFIVRKRSRSGHGTKRTYDLDSLHGMETKWQGPPGMVPPSIKDRSPVSRGPITNPIDWAVGLEIPSTTETLDIDWEDEDELVSSEDMFISEDGG